MSDRGSRRLHAPMAAMVAASLSTRAYGQDAAPDAGGPAGQPPADSLPVAPVEILPLPGGERSGATQAGDWLAGLFPGNVPHDLSPWGMFLAADVVVQAVMIGLVIASIITWTVWLAKTIELRAAKSRLRRMLSLLLDARTLSEAAEDIGKRRSVVRGMIEASRTELRLSSDTGVRGDVKERVASRLERIEIAAGRDMNRGTGILATIGSTAPFVGLFGTVWGIMNAFIGISEAQTTNLAVVAPGIAEALLATGLGLVAAIPAVIIYNQFARSIAGYKAMVGDASAAIMQLVSRDLDRGSAQRVLAKAAE